MIKYYMVRFRDGKFMKCGSGGCLCEVFIDLGIEGTRCSNCQITWSSSTVEHDKIGGNTIIYVEEVGKLLYG